MQPPAPGVWNQRPRDAAPPSQQLGLKLPSSTSPKNRAVRGAGGFQGTLSPLSQTLKRESEATGVGKHQSPYRRLGSGVGVRGAVQTLRHHAPAPPPHTPGQHWAPALIVEEAKAMTGAKGHKAPLGMERDSGDSSWWQALNKHSGLEASRPRQRSRTRTQPLVALPREALSILEEVHTGHADRLLRGHVT